MEAYSDAGADEPRLLSAIEEAVGEAGSLQGLQVVVSDIDAARAELLARGVSVSDVFHFEDGSQAAGPDPGRADYGTFLSFSDPDGNGWLLQEIPSRAIR